MRLVEKLCQGGRATASSAIALILCGTLAASGCGYRVASRNRIESEIDKLHVTPFKNETTTFQVEQILTRSVVNAFVRRTAFDVVSDPAQADTVMAGVVQRVNANPVIFGEATFGSTFLVTLNLRVELRNRASGKVLFQQADYVFREQYVINIDVENFFSELNPALGRIAEDLGASVVSTILEKF